MRENRSWANGKYSETVEGKREGAKRRWHGVLNSPFTIVLENQPTYLEQ